MQSLVEQITDRNRMENGKEPRKKLCGIHNCGNCTVIAREMKKLRDECERLYRENEYLKGRK